MKTWEWLVGRLNNETDDLMICLHWKSVVDEKMRFYKIILAMGNILVLSIPIIFNITNYQ